MGADWHTWCDAADCRYRCLREGCLYPENHLRRQSYDRQLRGYLHFYDCRVPYPSFPLPRAGADPSPRPAPAPAPISQQGDGACDLTKRRSLRYLSVHLEATLAYVMQHVVRCDFRAAQIPQSIASHDLGCAERTWRRDVALLVEMGVVRRMIGNGRPRTGHRGGSYYLVNWERVPMGAWPRSKPGRTFGKPGQKAAPLEYETRSVRREIRSFFGTENPAKMTPSPSYGRDRSPRPRDAGLTEEPAAPATTGNGEGPHPPTPRPEAGAAGRSRALSVAELRELAAERKEP